MASKRRATRPGVTPDRARELALALPGVEEGRSYGLPALKVGGKFLARLRDKNTVLVVHVASFPDRDYLLTEHPAVFFTTDHYRDHPSVLVRLALIREASLKELLTDAWRRLAPRKLVAEFDPAS